MFTKGFSIIGIGLGSIIAAVEIPISIFSAHIILHEHINGLQWAGVAIILLAVVLINGLSLNRKATKDYMNKGL